jgi:phosphoribosylformylglycinamidine cyclo-ligase
MRPVLRALFGTKLNAALTLLMLAAFAWALPPLFRWLQEAGGVPDAEMFRTFNMGVGMVAVVPASDVEKALAAGVGAFVLGEIVEGEGVVMA